MSMLREVGRFATVGVGATLVHLGVAWAAAGLGGLDPFIANGCGFVTAFAVSYLGHFYWTFAGPTEHRRHLPRFVIVSGIGYLLSNVIVWLVTTHSGYPFEVALLSILAIVPATTWTLSRIWAFRAGA